MSTSRHPVLGIALPDVLRRLAEHAARVGDSRVGWGLGADLHDDWRAASEPTDEHALSEEGRPFELVPFARWDAIDYALVVHADDPSLTPVCVSYAWADGEAFFLGQNAEEALANLVACNIRDVPEHLPDDAEGQAKVRDAAHELAAALELSLPENIDALEEGARSPETAFPEEPDGWTYEDCNDGIGVLAPDGAFDPDLAPIEPGRLFVLEEELKRVDDLLARGFPGSALSEARNVFAAVRLEDEHVDAAMRMRNAYRDLGRDFLAARAERYLARWGG